MDRNQLSAVLRPFGQEHLLDYWDCLSPAGQASLARQIESVDLALIERLHSHRQDQSNFREMALRATPPAAFRLDASKNRFSLEEARAQGRQALAAGHVGVILVAGGQGTRLGFDHPKGMFPIGPVSGRTLFQIHIEKMLAAARRFGVRIPLYLMTSPATHEETIQYLAANGRFGLAEEDLHVFCQGTMPAVDAASGRILLEAPDRLALSPNGHGGMLAAFTDGGSMADAQRRGIRHLFYFQVDNPLVDVAGAEDIGYHVLSEAEMTTQVIAKRDPLEKVGNVVNVDSRLLVIEYSDLPDDVARMTNPDGSLRIWAGSIAVHVFDLDFLVRAAAQLGSQSDVLPFHIAKKKVSYVEPMPGDPASSPILPSGKSLSACPGGQAKMATVPRRIEPDKPNAIKFERFIFDLMPAARNAIVVEVDPASAFAPLKNAPGAALDTPEAVQAQMAALHRKWLRSAGAAVADVPVEIGPSYALDAEELRGKLQSGMIINVPTYLV